MRRLLLKLPGAYMDVLMKMIFFIDEFQETYKDVFYEFDDLTTIYISIYNLLY